MYVNNTTKQRKLVFLVLSYASGAAGLRWGCTINPYSGVQRPFPTTNHWPPFTVSTTGQLETQKVGSEVLKR